MYNLKSYEEYKVDAYILFRRHQRWVKVIIKCGGLSKNYPRQIGNGLAQKTSKCHTLLIIIIAHIRHLDWLSTQWTLESYHRGQVIYDEHLRIVDNFYNANEKLLRCVRDLEKENAELKAKLKLGHQRQYKPNKKNKERESEEKGDPFSGKGIKNAEHQSAILDVGIGDVHENMN